jgi:hypothetical protein
MKATKHSIDCKMVFGRKDPACPRCQELIAEAAPRAGWQSSYFTLKAHNEQIEREAIRAHFAPGGPHATGKCGPICTAFDY